MRSQTPRSPPCLRGAPVRGAAFSPRWAQRFQARPEPSGGCWLWPKPRGWPAGPAQERRWGPEPELLVQVRSWPLSCVRPPPRVSAFPTVEQAQDGRRRTCRHPSSAQRWPQPCDPRCSPRGEGHVSSPAQAGLRAPTCADGGGQSVHESRERLAGGRGAVRGGRGAAQQVDPPRVLPELLQVPRQQAKLLALRPALLLQLPHPALRERRAQSAGAGRRGCTCEGERAVSVRAACHVCMWPVCTCVHVL